jgi:hypothetical protein
MWGKKICALVFCYSGPLEKAEEAMKPIRTELPPPILESTGNMPFPALQSLFDPLLPKGLQWYWKGDFVKELPDEAIEVHLEHAAKAPSELSLMHLFPIDGAVHGVGRNETAWNQREATWSMVIAGVDPDPAKAGGAHGVGQGILGSRASLCTGWRVREFHDGRGRGSHQSELWRKLRPSGRHQEQVRSDQLLPREPEH